MATTGATGRFGGQLTKRKSPESEPFDMGKFGLPYKGRGLENVYITLKLAPLPNGGHLKSRDGHPLFLYRPDKRLTGDDDTQTVYSLADVNYGLHQRRLYQDLKDSGVVDMKMPGEVMQHKEWPLTVDEFLGERMIIPIGVRGQNPNDPRFEGQILTVPAQVEGLAHGVPWMWPALRLGDTVGFRLGEVALNQSTITTPEGSAIARRSSSPALQLTPMVLSSGAPYHGIGDGENSKFELDFPEEIRVEEYERREDEFGFPMGEIIPSSRRVVEYVTRGFGHFIPLGKVGMTMGQPLAKDGINRAMHTYDALNVLIRGSNRLGLYLTPHPMVDRLQ